MIVWKSIFLTVCLGLITGMVVAHKMEAIFGSQKPPIAIQLVPQHALIVGAPRSGKSTSAVVDIVSRAKKGDCAIVLLDPHGPTADAVIEQLVAANMEHRLVVDDLSVRDRVLMYDVLRRSTLPDPEDRRTENEQSIDIFCDLLMRDRETPQIGPLQGKYARIAAKAWINQPEHLWKTITLKWLPYALMPHTDQFVFMLQHCLEGKTKAELERLYRFRQVASVMNEPEPARRLIDPPFECIQFEARVSKEAPAVKQMLSEKRIIIIRGDGSVPRWPRFILMSSFSNIVFRMAEQHYGATIKPLPVRIYAEECNGFPFNRQSEIDRMAESLKTGVEKISLYQHLNFDPVLRDPLLGVVGNIEVFRQSSQGAAIMAEEIGTHLFDPKKIKHEELRERTMVVGTKREELKRVSTSKSDGGNSTETTGSQIIQTPDYKVIEDRNITFESLDEQTRLFAKTLMSMPTGFRYVKRVTRDLVTVTPTPEKVIPLPCPWAYEATAKRMVAEALCRIRQQAIYQTPDFTPPTVPEEAKQQSQGAAATRKARKGTRKSKNDSGSGRGRSQ